jgi:hypothetical protein
MCDQRFGEQVCERGCASAFQMHAIAPEPRLAGA